MCGLASLQAGPSGERIGANPEVWMAFKPKGFSGVVETGIESAIRELVREILGRPIRNPETFEVQLTFTHEHRQPSHRDHKPSLGVVS